MRVFTHFYPINRTGDKVEGFRWRTLLQFGDSWGCIGTVVMKNPGSSERKDDRPINDTIILNHLKDYEESSDPWYEFGPDNTMTNVAKLFAFKYGTQHHSSLSGVVQIFNLFYVRDADLGSAINKASRFGCMSRFENEFQMTQYDCDHLIGPVYLGFSDLARNKMFSARARMFFDAVKITESGKYLNDEFLSNNFYHPQYLMNYGKNTHQGRLEMLRFRENAQMSETIEKELSSHSILESVKSLVEHKTSAQWWIYRSYDLGIKLTRSGLIIGIESWFNQPYENNDGCFHTFITVWNSNSFGK